MAQYSDIYKRWAEQQQTVAQMMKAARCWAGYEPVPGKAPYSEDSCRPAGSKKKPKKEEKKAANSTFPASTRPKMVQMPPKPAEPAVAARKAPANLKYHSPGQEAMAREVARKPQPSPPVTALGKAGSLRDAIKWAASSVYKLTEKQPEAVVDGKKPTSEGDEKKVTRAEPAKSEDLRPEEVQPSKS